MGKNYLDASQSMVRVSSASTETDYISVTVPFDWEAAPGRPAAAKSEIVDAPSLPLPPGRRPKDGFFLPISRPAQSPNLQKKEGGTDQRRPFSMKFLGTPKKTLFRSLKPGKIREDADCVEDTGGIFNSLSAHRFGSRISRRVLVESQKSPSCFRQCLPVGRKPSSSHTDHHRGRGLGSTEISDEDEYYATPLSSSHRGHGKAHDTSIAGAGKQLQVPSSSFRMASMLLALFSSESEESDKAEDTDEKSRIIVDDGDEVGISKHLIPRAPVSNSRKSRKLQQVPGNDNSTNKFDERNTVADCEGEVGHASSVSASSDRELRLRPTKGCRQSIFSWKSSDQVREKLDPLAAFLTVNVREAGEIANERSGKIDGEEDIKCQGSCSSLIRNFSSRDSNCSLSSSYSTTNPGENAVLRVPAASNMELSAPRSSCGSSDYPFITSSSIHSPQAEGERGTPTLGYATLSPLRRYYSEERLEPNQLPASRPISSLPQIPLQNQAALHIDTLQALRVEDKKVPSNSIEWLEELKSSSLWPKRPQTIFANGDAGNGDSRNGSSKDYEQSSTDSSEYGTPRAGPSTASMKSPVLRSLNISPKPATWMVSEEVLKLSPLLQRKLQQQQSQESPRSSFVLDEETTIVPTLNTAFEQISVSAPILLTGASDECHANSPDHGSQGENLAVLPVSGLSETPVSSSAEMNKAAAEESQDGVGSSGKSFPIYLRRRGSTIITGKAISRCDSGDESGQDSDNSSTDSFEQATPVSPILSRSSLIFCKFTISLEFETRIVSEEVLKSSSSFQCKLQRQLKIMGLQTKPLDGANRIENRITDSFEDGTLRTVSSTPPLNSLVFCRVNVSLEPESWVAYVEVFEEELKSSSLLTHEIQRNSTLQASKPRDCIGQTMCKEFVLCQSSTHCKQCNPVFVLKR